MSALEDFLLTGFKQFILRGNLANVAFRAGIVLLAVPFFAAQQNIPSSEPSPKAPPAASPNSRTVIILAKMKNGSSVELTPTDLEIKEDGNSATITSVHKLGRLPLHYCLVFDSSKSLAADFTLQQRQATELLTHAINAGSDYGWVVFFDTLVRESTEISDPKPIMDAIAQEKPGGGTGLYDAMGACAHRMLKSPADKGLRAMFLFIDGDDNASYLSRDQAGELALKAGLRIYAFLDTNSQNGTGEHTLNILTKSTGGRTFNPSGDTRMKYELHQISDDLQGLVEVTYTSASTSPRYQVHNIEIKPRAKGLQILAPEKYFASPN